MTRQEAMNKAFQKGMIDEIANIRKSKSLKGKELTELFPINNQRVYDYRILCTAYLAGRFEVRFPSTNSKS